MRDDSVQDIILDSIADGVFTVDRDWRITSFNRAAEEITGVPREEALGRPCWEVFHAEICEEACAIRETLRTGRPVVNRPIYIVDARGRRVPVSISTALLKAPSGEAVGAVETFRDLSLVEELRRELAGRCTFGEMVSRSPLMQRVFERVAAVAKTNSTVLIQGESGTGKELIARAIHRMSPRGTGPFVAVNCGALPESLLESELFGVRAGAYTDARADRPGRFQLAHGGVLLLDEIGEIPPSMQVKLLRVLEEKAVTPLGGTEPVRTDVRVLASTNADLEALVEAGRFRSDLYYRINVIRIELPPLRERPEDILLLVEHFLQRLATLAGRPAPSISPGAAAALLAHSWPGNVRELQNVVEHAFVLCPGDTILPEHLPPYLSPGRSASPQALSLAALEERRIREALERNAWHRGAAAKELGIHKTTLWRKMKRLGITPPQRR